MGWAQPMAGVGGALLRRCYAVGRRHAVHGRQAVGMDLGVTAVSAGDETWRRSRKEESGERKGVDELGVRDLHDVMVLCDTGFVQETRSS